MNVYWLWRLGGAVEQVIGSRRMVRFILTSALVAGAAQLAMFDTMGYGASGIGYAFFGFSWAGQKKYPVLKAALGRFGLPIFVFTYIASFVFLRSVVANGAHFGGLAFGACAALPFVFQRRRWLPRAPSFFLLVGSAMVAFVCPWSAMWWAAIGYNAHVGRSYDAAKFGYCQSLAIRPGDPWVTKTLASLSGDAGVDCGALR